MNATAKDSGKELKEFLEKNLPPLFPRASIKELTNGIISYRTMTNLDFKKMGPPYRKGRKEGLLQKGGLYCVGCGVFLFKL